MNAVANIPRPLLRYHGGKWQLADWIISQFPSHRTYVEPFGGGASILLRKNRSRTEIYNDLDQEIVNVFRVYRDPETAIELIDRLALTPYAREEFELAQQRCSDPIEQARRTIFRSFSSVGSDGATRPCRNGFKASGAKSEAPGWMRWVQTCDQFTSRLMGVEIESKPAIEILTGKADGIETLFYCDPPYVHSTRSSVAAGQKCYRHEMTDSDHRELATVLRGVKGMVVLSGYNCELYEELYGDWARVDHIAYSHGKGARTESLWFSPNIAIQTRLFEED